MVVGSLLLIAVAIGLLGYGLVAGSNVAFVASIAASLLAAVALVVGARQAAAARAVRRDDARDRERLLAGLGGGWNSRADEDREDDPGRDERHHDERRHDERHHDERQHDERQPVSVGARGAAFGDRDASEADQTAIFPALRDEGRDPGAGEDRYPLVGDHPIPTQHGAADVNRDSGHRESGTAAWDAAPDSAANNAANNGAAEPDDDDDDDDVPLNEPPAQHTAPGDAARVAAMSAEVVVVDGRPRYHKRGCVHLLGRPSEALPVSEAVELGFTPCSLCEPDSALLADLRRV